MSSEQSTRIANQATGDRIATRNAYETDTNGNARTLQIVGFSSRQIVVHPALRGYPTPVTVADTTNLNSLPAELTTNIIDIGDTNILVVDVEHTASDGSATITPLIFNEDETVVLALRASKTSGMGSVKFRRGGSGNYVSPQLQWDTLGASKIGLHISVVGGTANGVVLKGGALSPRVEPTTTSTTTTSSTSSSTSSTASTLSTTTSSTTTSTTTSSSSTSSSSSTNSTTSTQSTTTSSSSTSSTASTTSTTTSSSSTSSTASTQSTTTSSGSTSSSTTTTGTTISTTTTS